MAVQNRTTYQANVDTLIDNTGSGGTSGTDVETVLENLSDSVRHKKTGTSLGANPLSWDLENYDDYFHRCVLNANTAIALSNSQDGGVYYLMVTKSTASDVDLTFTETGQTVHYPNGGSNVLLSGSSGDIFYINVLRKGSEILVANPMYESVTGLSDVVLDTTPQLGGDLDLNGNAIDFPTTSRIDDVLDEDDLNSDSATSLATQQSIKAYVDNLEQEVNDLFDDQSVSLSTTTITLDFDSQRQRRLNTSTAHTANFDIAKSNDSNLQTGDYGFETSGTVVITLESDDNMLIDQDGWDDVNKELTISTDGKYELNYAKRKDGEYNVTLIGPF